MIEHVTTVVGNVYAQSNFHLACIVCGKREKVHLTAYRNSKTHIVGFVVGCDDCIKGRQTLRVYLEGEEGGV